MRAVTAASVLAMASILLVGCGSGGDGAGPPTFEELRAWLKGANVCDGVDTSLVRLPVRRTRSDAVVPAVQRFDQEASIGGLVGCGGANGYISYYRFPSMAARRSAVRSRDGLLANELFCASGAELVVNDLLGYDQTADFCRRLGFPIHRPTHVPSAAARRRHRLESVAARLFSRATQAPFTNVLCTEFGGGDLRFECQNILGGGPSDLRLTRRHGRYAIRGAAVSAQNGGGRTRR